MKPEYSFEQFLTRTHSFKEVALALAQNEEELADFEKTLHTQGFSKKNTPIELIQTFEAPNKVYIIVEGEIQKDMYDIALQYPTGQIELLNREKMEPIVVNPIYDGVGVVLLMSKEALLQAEQNNLRIRDVVGMTFQT